MKILHISHSDHVGGASKAAYRLHRALLHEGEDSRMYVRIKKSTDLEIIEMPTTAHRLERWRQKRRIKKISKKAIPALYDDRTAWDRQALRFMPDSDLVHLHWINQFIDIGSFFRHVDKQKPLVWSVNDMAPFTGGCTFSGDCKRYENQCGCCPLLKSHKSGDASFHILQRKINTYKQLIPHRLKIITTNNWMANQARKSTAFSGFETCIIPDGVNSEIFHPKASPLPATWDPPPAHALVLAVIQNLQDPRKGFQHILEAVSAVHREKKVCLVMVGEAPPTSTFPFPLLHLAPHLDGPENLAAVYAASDVFINASLRDNFPNTLLESAACGTPAISYDCGGIPEMIIDGETGFLAPVGNTRALTDALRTFLNDPIRAKHMSRAAREHAEKKFHSGLQSEQFISLYRSLTHR